MHNSSSSSSSGSVVARAVLALLILAAAGGIAYVLIMNPAKSETEEQPKKQTVTVHTQSVTLGQHPIMIEVMGQVRAAQEIELKARVSGEIVGIAPAFIPGGFLAKGDHILRIDPADYTLDVRMKEATLRQAQAAFDIEKGQQAIARGELKILKKSTGRVLKSTDLALRKPQMEQASANVESAQAQLEMSQLQLKRTSLVAPFNALLTTRYKRMGDIVSSQDMIATLAGTDEYWIDVELPVDYLRWITFSNDRKAGGSIATVELTGGRGERAGYARKMVGMVNAQSRLAQIIVSVPDPLLLRVARESKTPTGASAMILGDYVRVILTGGSAEVKTARIEQAYLRNGGAVWVVRDGKLIIQPVTIVYQDRFYAYITKGLHDGDILVTSKITTPINGMDIAIYGQDSEAKDSNDNDKDASQDTP